MRYLRSCSLVLMLIVWWPVAGFTQQFVHKGRVIDAETGEAVAFTSIQVKNTVNGTISDIDGKYSLTADTGIVQLIFSSVGYQPVEITNHSSLKPLIIKMKKLPVELEGVTVRPGINPALRIINLVSENRFMNDYEQLPAFKYRSYEKTYFGPESDSIPYLSSLAGDTSYKRSREFFARQHLFLMENVTERSYRYPHDNYRNVIASRVSGLSDPLFVFLISELQSTSFYKEKIVLADKEYVNPIAPGSRSRYYFEILDTLLEPEPYDTLFTILFRPKSNSNFAGLKGILSVSSNGYAIRSVTASPADIGGPFTIRIQQLYDYVAGKQWFPVQLNTDLVFNKAKIVVDKSLNTEMMIMGRGRSYITGIDLNPDLSDKSFGIITTEVATGAYSVPENEWAHYRHDSLTKREWETYRVIDSLGKAGSFDRRARQIDALFNARLHLGIIDFTLSNMIRSNQYEGIRTTIGLSTSESLLRWLQLSGYGAYGFKDQCFKYSLGVGIIVDKPRNTYFKFNFYDDLNEAGAGNPFTVKGQLLNPLKFREILIDRLDAVKSLKLELNRLLFKYLNANLYFNQLTKTPRYNYNFLVSSSENLSMLATQFNIAQVGITLRYAYGERVIRNGQSIATQPSNYPVLYLNYAHGFNQISGSDVPFDRMDFKLSKSFLSPFLGKTSVTVQAGIITKSVPYVMLYAAPASYANFTLYSPCSFTTMRINEFSSDRFVSLFLSHNIGALLLRTKYFRPEPEIVTNAGFGWLSRPEIHKSLILNEFSKGYFESGIVLNNLLDFRIVNLGFGGLYRYGPYGLPTFKENIALKLALQFMID